MKKFARDEDKTKGQLISELVEMRQRIGELEASEAERKQAEKILRLTQHTIDASLIPIEWVRPDASFMYVNDAGCNQLGYSPDELMSLGVPDIDPDWSSEYWFSEGWNRIKTEGQWIKLRILQL